MTEGSSKEVNKTRPSEGLMKLLAPDGYYHYLDIPKPKPSVDADSTSASVDEELVKKNYRRLSLRHHPDRPTGDADTFRVLNRAQKVLLNSKLRQQYDLLGMDLDDDEDEQEGNDDDDSSKEGDEKGPSSNPDSIMSQIASMTLAAIFQVIVRTVMMGLVSVVLVRFRITLFPALAFLLFVAYRVHSVAQSNTAASHMDMLSPIMIGLGLVLMYRGRSPESSWSYTFWSGEVIVMIMFIYNSVSQKTPAVAMVVALVAILLTLWLRGNPWKYATMVGLEVFVVVTAALAFPVMEMILEQILHEKMRKVGEKIRAHSERLEAYYGSRKEPK